MFITNSFPLLDPVQIPLIYKSVDKTEPYKYYRQQGGLMPEVVFNDVHELVVSAMIRYEQQLKHGADFMTCWKAFVVYQVENKKVNLIGNLSDVHACCSPLTDAEMRG
jgi:hypothetical protein